MGAGNDIGAVLDEGTDLRPGRIYVLRLEGIDADMSAVADLSRAYREHLRERGMELVDADYEGVRSEGRSTTYNFNVWFRVPTPPPRAVLPVAIWVAGAIVAYAAQYWIGRGLGYRRGFVAEAIVDATDAAGEGTRKLVTGAVLPILLAAGAAIGLIALALYVTRDAT